jgi:hypothetical protein
MDFDPWRWLALPVWGLLMFLAPPVIALFVWQGAGVLPALVSGLVAILLIRSLLSLHLLHGWHLIAAINGRHVVEPMPVSYLRLRRLDEREVQVRVKGHVTGLPQEGDRIAVLGSWMNGVLHVSQIYCLRTRAIIIPRQPSARTAALTGAVALLIAILWLLLSGVPWVAREFHRFNQTMMERQQPVFTPYHYQP